MRRKSPHFIFLNNNEFEMLNLDILQGKTVGLVLSGGGVKGIAHVGIIKALLEYEIYPNQITGVSAGALVGAPYANEVSIDDMLLFFKETPLFKYNFLTINKPGLFDTDKYIPFLEKYFTSKTFETLKRELHIVATNLESGTSQFFNSGELLKPLLASAALPPVFSPVSIDGVLYADGGIMNNFPIEPILYKTDYIIGSYTTSLKESHKSEIKNAIQLTNRVNTLMLHANSAEKLTSADLLFRPKDLDTIGILDKKGIEKAFTIGYDYAMSYMETIF